MGRSTIIVSLAAYARACGAGPETALQIGEHVAVDRVLDERAMMANVERLVAAPQTRRALAG
jgi:hypothetical protein